MPLPSLKLRNPFARSNRNERDSSGTIASSSLVDPENVDNQVTPADWRNPPTLAQTGEEIALVDLVEQRWRDAANHRRPVEREWVLSVAQFEGRQWLGWDDATHRAVNLMDEDEVDRYVTTALIAPLIKKTVAMVTQTRPDATTAPSSDSDRDRAAASEGRVITGHLSRLYGGDQQTQDVCLWAAICGLGYVKHYWDPKAEADIPIFGPDGSIVGKRSAPIGEECEEVYSPFQLYIDPVAKRWDRAGWLIDCSVHELSWFQERYGKRGQMVEPDQRDAFDGYVTGYMTNAYGGASQLSDWFTGKSNRKAAVCLEMWEKPSPRYPKGRYVVVAGKRLLYSGDWPLEMKDFPYSRLVCQEAPSHPYGMGIVKDLASLQIALNRAVSRIVERVEQDKLTVLLPKGIEVGADAYESDIDDGRNVRKIYYDPTSGGAPPTYQQAPGVTGDTWRLIDLLWLYMQHVAGIHDVNMGGTPTGITAGISIELLQQGDRSQNSSFTTNIEQYAVRRDETRISLYAQYAAPFLPRMMGLDDSGNPQTAQMRAQAFRALTGGGSCKVIVTPGSATPKSPAGEQQKALDFLKAGLFGPPDDPNAAALCVRYMSLAQSDMILDGLMVQIAQKQANDPGPAAIQAMQAQQAQQQLQMQLQAEQQKMQIQISGQAQLEAVKADAQAQLAQRIASFKTQGELTVAQQKAAAELQKLLADKTQPNITGTMDPTAMVDWEKQHGYEGKVPPPPAPKPGANGSSSSSTSPGN